MATDYAHQNGAALATFGSITETLVRIPVTRFLAAAAHQRGWQQFKAA